MVAMGVDDAAAALEAAGFEVDVEEGPAYIGLGYVMDVDPGAGTMLPKGSHGHALPRLTTWPAGVPGCRYQAAGRPPLAHRRRSLLATTACWGITFFLIKDLLDRVPALDFLAVRFAIAGC